MIFNHLARIEHVSVKSKLAKIVCSWCREGKDLTVDALTLASLDSLPPIGKLIADEPFWRYPLGAMAGQGVAHLRVGLTARLEPATWPSSPAATPWPR